MTLRQKNTFTALLAASSLAALLSACGSDSSAPAIDVFRTKLPALDAVSTAAGLSNSAVADLFDEAFLDSGANKAQLKATLAADAAALTATPDLSLFPSAAMTDVSVANCDTNGICTLTATLKNADVDATEVTFTTKVKNVNNSYVFYGDQVAS